MTDQQEMNTINPIPSTYERVRDLAHRGNAIKALMAKQDCDPLVKELLERELVRNDEQAYEALQQHLHQLFNANSGPWFPPAGIARNPKIEGMTILNASEAGITVSLANELPETKPGDCANCQDRENCFPTRKAEEVSPEVAKVLDGVVAELEKLFGGEDDHPEIVEIPPHLMARVEKMMAWSSHDAQEVVNMALHDFLTKTGY